MSGAASFMSLEELKHMEASTPTLMPSAVQVCLVKAQPVAFVWELRSLQGWPVASPSYLPACTAIAHPLEYGCHGRRPLPALQIACLAPARFHFTPAHLP